MRICLWCSKKYQSGGDVTFCSSKCKSEYNAEKDKETETRKSGGSIGIVGAVLLVVLGIYGYFQNKDETSKKPEQSTKEVIEQTSKKESIVEKTPIVENNKIDPETVIEEASTDQVTYSSNIAGSDATVFLSGFNSKIEGSYYYNRIRQEIQLIEYSRNEEEIELLEYANGKTYAKLTLKLFDNNTSSINGIFTSADGKKQYNFTMYKK
jgi:hypothetical protein